MKWLLGLAILGDTLAAFLVPDAKAFQQPGLARIIFFHLPCAIATPLFLFAGSYFSIRYLRSKSEEWDIRANSANELGYVLALLTMITGIIFSKVQWGAWWQWDPRQTSFLLLLLLYAAYFALRTAYDDEQVRAKFSAAYSAFSCLPAFFLIFVFPRLPIVESFHPNQAILSGGFDSTYRTVLYSMFFLILIFCIMIYRLSVRAGLLELRIRNDDGKLETYSGAATPTGVVRPISLP